MKSGKLSISDKVRKEYPEFVEEVIGLSLEHLEIRLARHSKQIVEIEDAKEIDLELAIAKEDVKVLAAPYSEAKKALTHKTRFIVELIKEKGGF